jgi:hypothetical protein
MYNFHVICLKIVSQINTFELCHIVLTDETNEINMGMKKAVEIFKNVATLFSFYLGTSNIST